ncbi:MAG: hypothetical protein WCW56_02635 [Candidatus Paceibacterota bacterium]|jgi:hypothetical protein
MKETYFTRNFWLMTGTFLVIVLVTMVGLTFLMQRADFTVTETTPFSR